MSGFNENLHGFPTIEQDPERRGSYVKVIQEVVIDPGAMTDGIATVDVLSPFGKGKGTAIGIQLLNTIGADNEIVGASVAAHATDAGYLTVTLHSNDNTSTTNLTSRTALIYGIIEPVDA